VRDVSHEEAEAQSQDVENVLRELGIEPNDQRIVEVWNKIDRLTAERREELGNMAGRQAAGRRPVLVSAMTGEGLPDLRAAIEARLGAGRVTRELMLDPADGAGLSWLHRHMEVLDQELDEKDGRLKVTVRGDPAAMERVKAKFQL